MSKPTADEIKKMQDEAWDDYGMVLSYEDAERMLIEVAGEQEARDRR